MTATRKTNGLGGIVDIKSHVKRNESLAREELEQLRTETDPEKIYLGLQRYIRLRYLLEDDPYWNDDIAAFTRYSIKKTLEQSDDPAKLSDLGVNCAGSSSETTKHLLLLISLRKGLDIDLDPEKAACTATVRELAVLLSAALLKAHR